MTQTRTPLVIAALIALLVAAALMAATTVSSQAGTERRSGHGAVATSHSRSGHPIYADVVYHPHQMCDEIHHPPGTMPGSPKL